MLARAPIGARMVDEVLKAKVLLLGDGGVGKTSLIRRFVVDLFSDDYITTIGTKVSKKEIRIGTPPNDTNVILQIWDVLGQRGYGGVQETAVKGARAVLYVYDTTRDETRRSLEDYWIPMVWRLTGRIPMVLAGNKADIVDNRMLAREFNFYMEQKYGAPAFLTSAKTGEAVEAAFHGLAEMALETVGSTPERVAIPTPPQEPVDRLIRISDRIMTDFCYSLGSVDAGMPVVKRQFERAGVDVRTPTRESLAAAVELLAHVERDFKSAEEIHENQRRRLAWLDGADDL